METGGCKVEDLRVVGKAKVAVAWLCNLEIHVCATRSTVCQEKHTRNTIE